MRGESDDAVLDIFQVVLQMCVNGVSAGGGGG